MIHFGIWILLGDTDFLCWMIRQAGLLHTPARWRLAPREAAAANCVQSGMVQHHWFLGTRCVSTEEKEKGFVVFV